MDDKWMRSHKGLASLYSSPILLQSFSPSFPVFCVRKMILMCFCWGEDFGEKRKTYFHSHLSSFSVSEVLNIFPYTKQTTHQGISSMCWSKEDWYKSRGEKILPSLLAVFLKSSALLTLNLLSSWVYNFYGVRPSIQFSFLWGVGWTVR